MAPPPPSPPLMVKLRTIATCGISPPEGSVPPTAVPLTFFDLMFLHARPMERLFFYPFPHPTFHFLSSFLPPSNPPSPSPSNPSSPSPPSSAPPPTPPTASSSSTPTPPPPASSSPSRSASTTAAAADFSTASQGPARATSASSGRSCLVLHRPTPPDPRRDGVSAPWRRRGDHHAPCGQRRQQLHTIPTNVGRRRPQVVQRHLSLDAHPVGPVVDRSLVPDPHGLYSLFYKTISGKSPAPAAASSPTDVVLASFTIKSSHVKTLKAAFRCSTAAITIAFTWINYVRARELAKRNDKVYLAIPVDFRRRMWPPLPAEYFRNCIGPHFVEAEAEDLSGTNGLTVAAKAIDKAIKSVASAGFEGAEPEKWLEMLLGLPAEAILIAGGSHRFAVYDMDFGWGRPVQVDLATVGRTGLFAVAESGEEEGGVEIGLAFPRNEMDLFQNFFAQGLGHLDG
uniref:Anthocyanin 5-aromatic acyltransferase n=1 Tax=Ananas comosus var. bracteatus TaxID=296719 RepID=A0A6V7NL12_ANACO|nr:unnamed protein product [Ananas comosus var. bracteatus]